jgi:hypothetical protein
VLEPEGPHKHATLPETQPRGRFTFCFVREPLSWYGSWWQMCNTTRPHHKLEAIYTTFPPTRFVNLPFPKYLNGLMTWEPGFLSILYRDFIGCDYVGLYENLVDDLVTAMRLAGEDFDEQTLRAVAPINVSGDAPDCPDELKEKLLVTEHETYVRFYSHLLDSRIERDSTSKVESGSN